MSFEYEVSGKKYKVLKPNEKQKLRSEEIRAKIFNDGLKDKNAVFNKEKLSLLKERGVWSEEDDELMNAAAKKVSELTEKLEKGGYDFNEAVEDAKECSKQRWTYFLYSQALNQMMSDTVESKSQSGSLNYLLSECIVDEENNPVCNDVDDFLARRDDDVISEGEKIFSEYWFGKVELPEQEFLKEFNIDTIEEEVKKVERKPFINAPQKE